MNLRRHKYEFTANCVGSNVYVFIILKVNKQKCKRENAAILYMNNYVSNETRYL